MYRKKEVSHTGTYRPISMNSSKLLNKQLCEWQRSIKPFVRKDRFWSVISLKQRI